MTRRGILGALGMLAAGPAGAGIIPEPRDPVTALWQGMELEGQDGRTFSISGGINGDPRGSATLIHLWAHWCSACLGEMASLASATASLGGSAPEVVLVSHPQFWEADQQFARRHALPFRLARPSAANPAAVTEAALLEGGAYVVPRSVLFGAAGRGAVWAHMGALSWSSPAVLSRLRTAG